MTPTLRDRRRLLAVLVVLVLLPIAYGVALALHGSNSIDRVPVAGLTPAQARRWRGISSLAERVFPAA